MGVIDWPALGNIAITALVTGIIVFAIQKFIERRLNRSLEELKAELSSEIQKEHIRYATTFPKTVELVLELQSKLVQVEKWTEQIKRNWPDEDIDSKEVAEHGVIRQIRNTFEDYRQLLFEKGLYLPEDLYDELLNQNKVLFGIALGLDTSNSRVFKDEEINQGVIEQLKGLTHNLIESFDLTTVTVRQMFRKVIDGKDGKAGKG